MPEFLIVYSSTHGHNKKIAERVAKTLREDGGVPVLFEASSALHVSPSDYDAVIVGGSIHVGHHQPEVVDWVKKHAIALTDMPSAFFSVCLTSADDTDEARATAQTFVDDFLDDTGWTPRKTAVFAGALQYLEYNLATRLLIKMMMKRDGRPTDTSRDYDYTDWDAVESFGHECASMLVGAGVR